MKKVVSVNVGNYYTEANKEKLIKLLKEGEVVSIYVECAGKTRAQYVEESYITELKKELQLKEGKGNFGSTVYYI